MRETSRLAFVALLLTVSSATAGVASFAPHGPMLLTDQGPSKFGWSVAALGDIHSDFWGDFAVGEPIAGPGRVLIFNGRLEGLPALGGEADLVLTGHQANEQFGFSVASVGDLDLDGRPDILVGAPLSPGLGGQSRAGRVYLYLTSDLSAPVLTLVGPTIDARLGMSVAGGIDVTGDGIPELLIGAPLMNAHAGAVYMVSGALRGTHNVAAVALATVHGDAPGDNLGMRALALYPEGWLIGVPNAGADDRGALILRSLDGLTETRRWWGSAPAQNLGFEFARMDTFEGPVILVGAPGASDAAGLVHAITLGSIDPVFTLLGTTGSSAGASVAAGDFNGDGIHDVVVGGPTLQNDTRSPGGIFYVPGPVAPGTHDLDDIAARIMGPVNSDRFGFDVDLVVAPDAGHGGGILVGAPRATPQTHLLLNSPPRPAFVAPDLECRGALTQVNLTGLGSTDPDGFDDIKLWDWKHAGATFGTQPNASLHLPPGNFPVTLRVTDAFLDVGQVTRTVRIADNSPPHVQWVRAEYGAVYFEDEELIDGLRVPFALFAAHIDELTLKVNAWDDCSPIDRVEFWIDDVLEFVDREAPWEHTRDPHAVLPAFERARAIAYDKLGYRAEACMAMVDTAWVNLHHLPVVGDGPPPVPTWRLDRLQRGQTVNVLPACEGELVIFGIPVPVRLS